MVHSSEIRPYQYYKYQLEKSGGFLCKNLRLQGGNPIRKLSGEWLEKGTGVKSAQLEGAHLLLPGYGEKEPTLEIFQYAQTKQQEPLAPNKRGFGHIAFEVENVESVLAILEENGGKPFAEICRKKIDGAGEITFVYATDPEGNLIELQSWK